MEITPEAKENLGWAEEQFTQLDGTIQISEPEAINDNTNTLLPEVLGHVAINDQIDLPANTVDVHTKTKPIKSKASRTKVPVATDNVVRTNDTRTAIGLYLHEIGKIPLLDAEQERVLARAIELGITASKALECPDLTDAERHKHKRDVQLGADAKDTFIRSNLRLVVSIAKRRPVLKGMELIDLIQEGNLGLEHAVDKFEWRKGFKFSTYATFWIRQAIGRGIDNKSRLIRLPPDIASQLRTAVQEAEKHGTELNDENAHLMLLSSPISLNKKISYDGVAEIGDLIAGDDAQSPENMFFNSENSGLAMDLLNTLEDRRTRVAIDEYYGISSGERRALNSVGADFGVTGEAIRRVIYRGISQMKENYLQMRALDKENDL